MIKFFASVVGVLFLIGLISFTIGYGFSYGYELGFREATVGVEVG